MAKSIDIHGLTSDPIDFIDRYKNDIADIKLEDIISFPNACFDPYAFLVINEALDYAIETAARRAIAMEKVFPGSGVSDQAGTGLAFLNKIKEGLSQVILCSPEQKTPITPLPMPPLEFAMSAATKPAPTARQKQETKEKEAAELKKLHDAVLASKPSEVQPPAPAVPAATISITPTVGQIVTDTEGRRWEVMDVSNSATLGVRVEGGTAVTRLGRTQITKVEAATPKLITGAQQLERMEAQKLAQKLSPVKTETKTETKTGTKARGAKKRTQPGLWDVPVVYEGKTYNTPTELATKLKFNTKGASSRVPGGAMIAAFNRAGYKVFSGEKERTPKEPGSKTTGEFRVIKSFETPEQYKLKEQSGEQLGQTFIPAEKAKPLSAVTGVPPSTEEKFDPYYEEAIRAATIGMSDEQAAQMRKFMIEAFKKKGVKPLPPVVKTKQPPAPSAPAATTEQAEVVTAGYTVTVEDSTGARTTYSIAALGEVPNPEAGIINANSPIARCLMGRKVGDSTVCTLPDGKKLMFRIWGMAKRTPGKPESVEPVSPAKTPEEIAEEKTDELIERLNDLMDEDDKANSIKRLEGELDKLDANDVEGIQDVRDKIEEYRSITREGLSKEEYDDEKQSAFQDIMDEINNLSYNEPEEE